MITNRNPASTMNDSTAITLAPQNGRLRKNRSSSSGSARRRSTATNAASAAAEVANKVTIRADPHP